jgi:hypothetical protein
MTIGRSKGKWAVKHCHGKSKGKVIAKHDTKRQAIAQHRAIQANKERRRR